MSFKVRIIGTTAEEYGYRGNDYISGALGTLKDCFGSFVGYNLHPNEDVNRENALP
jgi:hypothetical protein